MVILGDQWMRCSRSSAREDKWETFFSLFRAKSLHTDNVLILVLSYWQNEHRVAHPTSNGHLRNSLQWGLGFAGGTVVKNSPANAGAAGAVGSITGLGRSLGGGHATHSSILAWEIPWTEEPGGLQSMGVSKESDMTEWLSRHTCTSVGVTIWHRKILGEERGTFLRHCWTQEPIPHHHLLIGLPNYRRPLSDDFSLQKWPVADRPQLRSTQYDNQSEGGSSPNLQLDSSSGRTMTSLAWVTCPSRGQSLGQVRQSSMTLPLWAR